MSSAPHTRKRKPKKRANVTRNYHLSSRLRRTILINKKYRDIMYTGRHLQLVGMSIPASKSIPMETHPTVDQFIYVERGRGQAKIRQSRTTLVPGSAIVVPAGASHSVRNMSATAPLKLFTIYAPPEHHQPPQRPQRWH